MHHLCSDRSKSGQTKNLRLSKDQKRPGRKSDRTQRQWGRLLHRLHNGDRTYARVTRPPCTSSMLYYRCAEKPHRNHHLWATGKPGQTKYSKPTPHQHQHAHRAACAVASTSREDAAHCGAGPPCTFRYAPIPELSPTINNPPRWYPIVH